MAQKLKVAERIKVLNNVYDPVVDAVIRQFNASRLLRIENPDDPIISEVFNRYDALLGGLQAKKGSLKAQIQNAGDTKEKQVRVGKKDHRRTHIRFPDGEPPVPDPEGHAGTGLDLGAEATGAVPNEGE